jgi:hypothetical protein
MGARINGIPAKPDVNEKSDEVGKRHSDILMKFDAETARRSIYVDFEGEGKNTRSRYPLPHMVGIFRPAPVKGGGGEYEAVFFREAWKAPVNGSREKSRTAGFAETIVGLIEEAKARDGLICFWSEHELVVIKANAPELADAFETVGFNLLPPLRTIKNRNCWLLDKSSGKGLNQYLEVFLEKRPRVGEIKPGPAEACRRIDRACGTHGRWKNWPENKKEYVRNLISYNKEDCKSTWLLGRKLGNMNGGSR